MEKYAYRHTKYMPFYSFTIFVNISIEQPSNLFGTVLSPPHWWNWPLCTVWPYSVIILTFNPPVDAFLAKILALKPIFRNWFITWIRLWKDPIISNEYFLLFSDEDVGFFEHFLLGFHGLFVVCEHFLAFFTSWSWKFTRLPNLRQNVLLRNWNVSNVSTDAHNIIDRP